MGADCKSVGLAYEGSNPSPATPGTTAPDLSRSGAVRVLRERRRPGAGGRGALQRLAAEEQPAEGDLDVARAADGHLGAVGLGRPGVQRRPAVGELVGDGRLRGGPGERQLGADAARCRRRPRRSGWPRPARRRRSTDCTSCCSRKASEAAIAPNAISAATVQQTSTNGSVEPRSPSRRSVRTRGSVGGGAVVHRLWTAPVDTVDTRSGGGLAPAARPVDDDPAGAARRRQTPAMSIEMPAAEVHALAGTLRGAAARRRGDRARLDRRRATWAARCSRPSRRSSTPTGPPAGALAGELGWLGATVAAVADSWLALDRGAARRRAEPGERRMTVALPEPVPLEMPPGRPGGGRRPRPRRRPARRTGWPCSPTSCPARPRRPPAGSGTTRRRPPRRWRASPAIAREAAAAVLRRHRPAGRARGAAARGPAARWPRSARSRTRTSGPRGGALGAIEDPRLAVMTGSPAWVGAVVEDRGGRGRAVGAGTPLLLEELADDAAATARVLAGAAGRWAARGGPATAGGCSPTWRRSCPAGATRSWPAAGARWPTRCPRPADARRSGSGSPRTRRTWRRTPPSPTACSAGWASEAFGQLLDSLGQAARRPRQPAGGGAGGALGAAVPAGGPTTASRPSWGPPTSVPTTATGAAGGAAAGMAAVLSAGSGAPRRRSAAGDGRGVGAAAAAPGARRRACRPDPSPGHAVARGRVDPSALAVGILARGGEPEAAAALLGDERVWEALLVRFWGDGGTALGELVAEAGARRRPGRGTTPCARGWRPSAPGSSRVTRRDWTVTRDVVAAVAPALGRRWPPTSAVAADAARRAGGRRRCGRTTEGLVRGSGYLTVDRQAAAAVEGALRVGRPPAARPGREQSRGPAARPSPSPPPSSPSRSTGSG